MCRTWVATGLSGVLAVVGCLPAGGGLCELEDDCEPPAPGPYSGVQSCDLHEFHGSPEGVCVPYVDAGWHTALVRMAHVGKEELRCPESAPFPGLWGEEVTPPGVDPRRVIGCSVHALATCTTLAFACVPFEEDYPACINQDGPQVCPDAYPFKTTVEKDGVGGETTVCCRTEPPPG